MRVLILRRQEFGGIATYTNLLADALHDEDIEAIVDDAEDWIPNKTGWRVDREVAKVLKAAARGFDIVHAFGYRTAWACSAAFYVSGPWIYTAYDMPRTTHVELIKRLNTGRIGLCSSHAVRNKLADASALNLEVIPPGIRANTRVLDRQESRGMHGVSDGEILIVAAGRFVEERGFESLIAAVHSLPRNFRLILSGKGPLEDSLVAAAGDKVTVTHELFSQQVVIAAADLVVVPSTRAGFSYTALEAMHQATIGGARTIALTNVEGSQAHRRAEGTILLHAGPEIGVASSKTFINSMVAMFLLATHLGAVRGVLGSAAPICG